MLELLDRWKVKETAMAQIKLEECPQSIVNHYDKAASSQRVKRVSATLLRNGNEQYTITHSFGQDRWQFIDHEWRIVSK